MNATAMQPTSLKALAARVRECNPLCNSNATTQTTMQKGMQLSMQLSPENDPEVALKVAVAQEVDIQKMSLSVFEKAGLVVPVWSEILMEKIYFVSSDAVINNNPLDAVSYTARELTAMLDMEQEEVQAVHEVKRLFYKGRVIAHNRITL